MIWYLKKEENLSSNRWIRREKFKWVGGKKEQKNKECSFSFSSIHATRHTPHTCQKSCRKGGADQQGDEDRGRGTEAGTWRRNGGICGGCRWGSGEKMDGEGGGREDRRETEKKIEGGGRGRGSRRGAGVYLRGRGGERKCRDYSSCEWDRTGQKEHEKKSTVNNDHINITQWLKSCLRDGVRGGDNRMEWLREQIRSGGESVRAF